jgi:TRAP-type C4-dicarboxylate transport system permease small subunit
MSHHKKVGRLVCFVALAVSIFVAHPALADSSSASVDQVQTFIQSVIKVIAGLSGLVATAFFVIGGYQYMTSSGNPQHMERAKRTLVHAAVGLTIVIAAFVIASIITDLATSAFGS